MRDYKYDCADYNEFLTENDTDLYYCEHPDKELEVKRTYLVYLMDDYNKETDDVKKSRIATSIECCKAEIKELEDELEAKD